MVCSWDSSRYKYESCGHVVTGELSIIKDVKLRNLISKGPAYREQNSIDWKMNLKNCKLKLLFQGMQRSGLRRQMWTDMYLETGRKRCINLLMRRLEA